MTPEQVDAIVNVDPAAAPDIVQQPAQQPSQDEHHDEPELELPPVADVAEVNTVPDLASVISGQSAANEQPVAEMTATPAPVVDEQGHEEAHQQTLAELEQAVHSPHVAESQETENAARTAVTDAINAVGFDTNRPEPVRALNAQPVNLDLGRADNSPPSVPPPMMPPLP